MGLRALARQRLDDFFLIRDATVAGAHAGTGMRRRAAAGRAIDVVNPTFGWKEAQHPVHRPEHMSRAKLPHWASFSDAAEMRTLGHEFLKDLVKAGATVRQLV